MVIFFYLQTHLTFGKEFTQAVELKQVAQQDAEKARFLVEKVIIMRISITTFLSSAYSGLQVVQSFVREHRYVTIYVAHYIINCVTFNLISTKNVANKIHYVYVSVLKEAL